MLPVYVKYTGDFKINDTIDRSLAMANDLLGDITEPATSAKARSRRHGS